MKAVLDDKVIAESDDVIAAAGYDYFPPSAVRTEWLEKTEKTAKDRECPHGVSSTMSWIGGKRHRAMPGSTRRRSRRYSRSRTASASGKTSRSADDWQFCPVPMSTRNLFSPIAAAVNSSAFAVALLAAPDKLVPYRRAQRGEILRLAGGRRCLRAGVFRLGLGFYGPPVYLQAVREARGFRCRLCRRR